MKSLRKGTNSEIKVCAIYIKTVLDLYISICCCQCTKSRWGYHMTFWVQNTEYWTDFDGTSWCTFSTINNNICIRALYTQNVLVLNWCSIKIYWCLHFGIVMWTIFWLSIKEIPQKYLWTCHKCSSFVVLLCNPAECVPGPIKICLLQEKLLGKNKLEAAWNYVC